MYFDYKKHNCQIKGIRSRTYAQLLDTIFQVLRNRSKTAL